MGWDEVAVAPLHWLKQVFDIYGAYIPIPITIPIRFSYMMKVYGVTNTEIYEEPHYTVICDQRQVIM